MGFLADKKKPPPKAEVPKRLAGVCPCFHPVKCFSSQNKLANAMRALGLLMDSLAVGPGDLTQSSTASPQGWRRKALPTLGPQGRPELFCFGLSQVSAFLQQGRAVRQAPASVDEDLRLMDPSLLIAMESPDPAVVAVNQRALSHDHASSTSVLAMVGLGGQVAFWLGSRPKKGAGPSPHPTVT